MLGVSYVWQYYLVKVSIMSDKVFSQNIGQLFRHKFEPRDYAMSFNIEKFEKKKKKLFSQNNSKL